MEVTIKLISDDQINFGCFTINTEDIKEITISENSRVIQITTNDGVSLNAKEW